jgi:antimicrobial peptide system SdpA family protein
MKPNDPLSQRAAGALLAGMVALAAVGGLYAVHVPMPHNPIHLPYEKKVPVVQFLPEGWKFFTRDPQEEEILLYERAGGAWVRAKNIPNGRAENLFGGSRRGRASAIELGRITGGLPRSSWQDCSDDPAKCLDRLASPRKIKNDNGKPQICGAVGVALQKPVPWAWATSKRSVTMPSRVALLEIQC